MLVLVTVLQIRLDRSAVAMTPMTITTEPRLVTTSVSPTIPAGTGKTSSRLAAIREKNKVRVAALIWYRFPFDWSLLDVHDRGEEWARPPDTLCPPSPANRFYGLQALKESLAASKTAPQSSNRAIGGLSSDPRTPGTGSSRRESTSLSTPSSIFSFGTGAAGDKRCVPA